MRVGILAPHPDDFDAIGVTMRFLHEAGHALHLAVVTSGASGVEDGYEGARRAKDKRAIREREQLASIRLFGLPADRVSFLHTEEDAKSHPLENDTNLTVLRAWLTRIEPSLVFCPHYNDPNVSHQRTYAFLAAAVRAGAPATIALLNRDPKTIAMRPDVFLPFREDMAEWKGALLRCHASQQARNIARRGHGVDARVLDTNRTIARELALTAPYAETFEVDGIGA